MQFRCLLYGRNVSEIFYLSLSFRFERRWPVICIGNCIKVQLPLKEYKSKS